ncbi:MAG: ABC transporter ATP-binding protein [Leptolyngbyaceae cyanobacterium bins.302]|nr:ABC transporter ATP-binding protein [Leptolyngbyaceae cyanobacterium bins.302]
MAQVVLENIYKSFQKGERQEAKSAGQNGQAHPAAVLRNINLAVGDGEFMVLVGPSGCGKSTLLRLLAGLEEVTGGNIYVSDRLVNEVPPKDRDIAMVFQNYALYPHMTVYDNLAFGLRRTGQGSKAAGEKTYTHSPTRALPLWLDNLLIETTRQLPKGLRYQSEREKAIDQQVRTIAQILQIEGLLNRLPKQLSGGQKQRVALGRAMARNPQVFLMDEPLSNLDAKLRAETRSQIVKLQRQLGTTTIYVTHDQTEAMTMGDRIAVMNAGQIQQIASPLEIYNHPANLFVAEFIGSPPMNFLPVQFKSPLLITHDQFRLTLPPLWEPILQSYDGRSLTLGIRPEHLSVSVPAPKNLHVRVELVEALGSETYIAVRRMDSLAARSQTLQARIEPDRSVQVGEELWLAIAPEKLHLFDPNTGLAISP